MDQLSVSVGHALNLPASSKSAAEMEKEELAQLVPGSGGKLSSGMALAKRRASRPLLWLGNLGALPYFIKSTVWPSSRKTSET
jgi:hypothetical protein